ncbi:MAG: formyltransferase family protein [Bacteroidota bacterium]
MAKRVVLLTGSELRHDFFRIAMARDPEIRVVRSYCESQKGNLQEQVREASTSNSLRTTYLESRSQTERDFFELYCRSTPDLSNPCQIVKGDINRDDIVEEIIELAPDIIVAYGCSIIRSRLLAHFRGCFINIHLGISPYYRGSGTNFWPFVNNELSCVGTTFMHIDEGIDTGKIIHQIRARMDVFDNIHQVGNRLICDSVMECRKLIRNFENLSALEGDSNIDFTKRYYRKKDFTEEALQLALANIVNNNIGAYLSSKADADRRYPILQQSNI